MSTNHLQRCHKLQEMIIDKYIEVTNRPRPRSMRQLYRQYVNDDRKHRHCLQKAQTQAIRSSEATSKLFGMFVIIHIKNCLEESGENTRTKRTKVHQSRIYDLIRKRGDLHTHTRFGDVCKAQISFLQKIGAELEAFAIINFMEEVNPSGVELFDEFNRDIFGLFKFSEEVEIDLNDVRVMYNS